MQLEFTNIRDCLELRRKIKAYEELFGVDPDVSVKFTTYLLPVRAWDSDNTIHYCSKYDGVSEYQKSIQDIPTIVLSNSEYQIKNVVIHE